MKGYRTEKLCAGCVEELDRCCVILHRPTEEPKRGRCARCGKFFYVLTYDLRDRLPGEERV